MAGGSQSLAVVAIFIHVCQTTAWIQCGLNQVLLNSAKVRLQILQWGLQMSLIRQVQPMRKAFRFLCIIFQASGITHLWVRVGFLQSISLPSGSHWHLVKQYSKVFTSLPPTYQLFVGRTGFSVLATELPTLMSSLTSSCIGICCSHKTMPLLSIMLWN